MYIAQLLFSRGVGIINTSLSTHRNIFKNMGIVIYLMSFFRRDANGNSKHKHLLIKFTTKY